MCQFITSRSFLFIIHQRHDTCTTSMCRWDIPVILLATGPLGQSLWNLTRYACHKIVLGAWHMGNYNYNILELTPVYTVRFAPPRQWHRSGYIWPLDFLTSMSLDACQSLSSIQRQHSHCHVTTSATATWSSPLPFATSSALSCALVLNASEVVRTRRANVRAVLRASIPMCFEE